MDGDVNKKQLMFITRTCWLTANDFLPQLIKKKYYLEQIIVKNDIIDEDTIISIFRLSKEKHKEVKRVIMIKNNNRPKNRII